MQKLLLIGACILMLYGCKNKEGEQDGNEDELVFFSFQDMPKEQEVDPEANEILLNWKEYQDFQSSLNVMYRGANNEDLALAVEDLVEKEQALQSGGYPEVFHKPQIKSRQRVFKTYLLKLKASIEDRTDVNEPMRQLLTANNAWRNQFNVIISNKLDTKLILDEN